MGKKQIISALNRDLAKWVTLSEKYKKSSAIQYAKLKSSMAIFENNADLDELNNVQSQLGLSLAFINILLVLILFFRETSPRHF